MGVETVSIDNYFAGKHENLAHLKRYPNFHEVECDITDAPGCEAFRRGRRGFSPGGVKKTTVSATRARPGHQREGGVHLLEWPATTR